MVRLAPGAGIAGFAAQCQQVTAVRDAANDPRLDIEEQRRLHIRLGHVLAAPVVDASGALLGVLQARGRFRARPAACAAGRVCVGSGGRGGVW